MKSLSPDPCLICELADCDDNNPKCVFNKTKCRAQRDYYHRMKHDHKFRLKRLEAKKEWLKTESGRKSNAKSVSLYRKKNPEIISKIQKRYDENHKEQRRAKSREYRRIKRLALQRLTTEKGDL